jgi:hypothetical protein
MTRLSLSFIERAPKTKSKASRIAELLPEVEAALTAGHSHQTIFEQVKNTTGLQLTFGYYENTIHRIRQRQQKKATGAAKPPAAFGLKPSPTIPGAIGTAQDNGAPTSKLQAALGEPIDDFFS